MITHNRASLTRQAVGLHLEICDVVVAAISLRTYTLLPGSHGDGASLGMDLLRNAFKIA